MGEKTGQSLFFTGKFAFFFQKSCVYNNFLGPKKKILKLPHYLSEHLWDIYKLSFEVRHTP